MKQFETSVFLMYVYDDTFIEFVAKKDALLDADDFWESKKMILEHQPGKKFYALVNGKDFFNVTKEAREIAASKEFSDHLEAVALCSNNFALKIFGNLYIKINKPNTLTQFFDDRQKAEDWLRSQMK